LSAADLAFLGATIEPIRPAAGPAPDALAVRGGRIVAVGGRADVEALIGSATRVIRLDGETLLPGFQDAHIHPVQGELTALSCDLNGLEVDRFAEAIAAYAARHPERDWIVGAGWSVTDFAAAAPRRATLDALVPDRPVFLWSRDGHSAWVNSRALALAGITAATPDPAGGLIVRDPDGSPSGTLREGAMSLVEELAPPPSDGSTPWASPPGRTHRSTTRTPACASWRHTGPPPRTAALRRGWWRRSSGIRGVGWNRSRASLRSERQPASGASGPGR
jgi:predicted amidohydrolase YtcJ